MAAATAVMLALAGCVGSAMPLAVTGAWGAAPRAPSGSGSAGGVYAHAGSGMLAPAAAAARPLVYVPDVRTGEVTVIDSATLAVLERYRVGRQIQHVVPSYDLKTLYATDDTGKAIVPFDPVTGKPGRAIRVNETYNLYFSADGRSAIGVAEGGQRLIFYDPRSWQTQGEIPVPGCAGIDHADFTADGRLAVFTCEFAGRVAVVDVASRTLQRMIDMPVRHTRTGPQDIRLSPDGSRFYIADSDQNGLWVLNGAATKVIGVIPTGRGPHGLYLDRDGRRLFVGNRLEGSISVLDPATGKVTAKWAIPGGGSPDMGGLTAAGTQLWLSGRYDRAVYVLSTIDGSLIRKFGNVGREPHGLAVWPQPGRYSLGHTGITR